LAQDLRKAAGYILSTTPESEMGIPTIRFRCMPAHDGGRSRREFFSLAGAIAAGTTCGQDRVEAVEPESPPIGILLATTFTTGTLEARLDSAKACGLACVQMSMVCANLPEMPDQIPTGLPERIHREALARGIAIASVTGTLNMSHPDVEHRRTGLGRLRVLAEACPRMSTSSIHVCTGTRDPNSMWRHHPENGSPESWRDMAACMREATDIARQANVVLAFEPEMSNVVDSARKARRLLDEIGSPHLKVTIDPANLFHAGELPRMKEILDEAFALLGKDIVLAHAKDLDRDGEAGHKAAGQGVLDYDRYLGLLRKYDFKGPLLLHGLSIGQVPGCMAFLRAKLSSSFHKAARRAGVSRGVAAGGNRGHGTLPAPHIS
jgi:sugar phosphate isomerase/epimerase